MKIVEYAKEHPYATGVIVLIGGIIFILIVRGGSSGGGGEGGASRPSDAEIAANAQIAAAQIAAQAQAAQAGAAVQAAQIGAGVQLNSDNRAAEVAMAQIAAERDLGIKMVEGQTSVVTAQVNAQAQQRAQIIGALGGVKKKNRDDVLQALITGQPYYPQHNPGNSIAGIIGSIGSAAGNILPFFSDMRLKENIRYIGEDERGLGIYEFNYKGSNRTRRGVIAQDVARKYPDAVIRDNNKGYYKVDPKRLPSPVRAMIAPASNFGIA